MSKRWTFLTNHSLVLLAIARKPDSRLKDLAEHTELTERAVTGIISDLCAGGYVTRNRQGRRTTYTIQTNRGLRHRSAQRGDLVRLFEIIGEGA
jgi:DNA-binding MarR family transcriptional regulator